MKIACCGMIVCDLPMYPIPLDMMSLSLAKIEPVAMTTGGDALNVAKTLGILGADVSLVGRVGADLNGDFVVAHTAEQGIATSGIKRDSAFATSTSYHLIDKNGKTHTVSYTPLNDELCAADFPIQSIEGAGIVYFGSALTFPKMDGGGIAELFACAHEITAKTALDTSLDIPAEQAETTSGADHFEMLKPALRVTDIFIPSISEAAYLTGTKDPHENALAMRPLGIGIFGVKLGGKGCYLTDYENEYYIGAFDEFKPLDTVGAGDSFMGSFLFGVSRGWGIEQSGVFASLVSSFNVAALGATGGVPDFETARAYLETHSCTVDKRPF